MAAWGLALNRWKQLNDFQRHGGAYTKAPIARQAFSAVPLRAFDLLWNERRLHRIHRDRDPERQGWTVPMELIADSTEQVYVRPTSDVDPEVRERGLDGGVRAADDRNQHRRTRLPASQAGPTPRPWEARRDYPQPSGAGAPIAAWDRLQDSIRRLFDCEILPPDSTGADIVAEYRARQAAPARYRQRGKRISAGADAVGFLHTRPASVLLVDEPDAHLHVILQDTIYSELRSVAAAQNSQLIIATHSEVIINSVEPSELCMLFDRPELLTTVERNALADSLGILTHTDIMMALKAPGVLYVEDYTDIDILREWAKVLNHPAWTTLTTKLFWKKAVWETRRRRRIKAKDHYEAIQLVRENLPGLELLDGDAHSNITGDRDYGSRPAAPALAAL